MKKVLMFLGLKIVEILLIVFIPYTLGHILPWAKFFGVGYWLNGILATILPLIALFFVISIFYLVVLKLILYWLDFNWDIIYKEEMENPFRELIRKLY